MRHSDKPLSAISPQYAKLCKFSAEISMVSSIGSLLNWDQETYMPAKAAAHRAEQAAFLSALAHEKATCSEIGDLISACEQDRTLTGDSKSSEARNIREMRRDFEHRTKLPTELVAELARVGSQAQEVWKTAREKNDFAMFRPWLEKMMDLTRRKAECLGNGSAGELYDALLDEYEPGATAKEIEGVFMPLAERLSLLVKELGASGKPPSDAPLRHPIDPSRQHELGLFVIRAMGFDLEAGRLDTTAHPFCSGMGPGDTRLTTRYREQSWTDALYSTMHEAGHGIYEQSLPKTPALFGTPISEAISLGIHESQSRMWENFVGRSREFWVWLLPQAKQIFGGAGGPLGGALRGVSVEEIFAAVNTAKPSLIRVEADEATYNLHVLIRFRLERALISGQLAVKDVPGEWNAAYKKYLGVTVPDDARGCLQDVHWSFGLIGYFPTYTLGNLYCAQLWETINKKIPSLGEQMSRGDFGTLKAWLNQNIHAHGRRYRAGELCEMLTGKPLSADPLMRHLEGKLRPLFR
jgi:carboxypeptidase Taq